jgi:two-component system OmpR family sensor kinase
LLVYLLTAIVVGGALGALSTYRVMLRESDDILDYHLRQVALSIGDQALAGSLPGYVAQEDAQYDFVIQIWDQDGVRRFLSHPHSGLPGSAQFGYSTTQTKEGGWRIYSFEHRDRIIQVAQPLAVRERLAAGMALRMLTPFLLLVPLLVLLVWLAIGRGLAPLNRLASAVIARNPESMSPLEISDVPSELKPVVTALNDLLQRLDASLDGLRAFTADAAHELRTPLAALQLQAQLIERSRDDAERGHAVARLKTGLQRANHVVEQLLTLARQEGMANIQAGTLVDLNALAGSVAAELLPIAQVKEIDLGVVSEEGEAKMPGDASALRILLTNLVDNALRHSPSGGRVDVKVSRSATACVLCVADNGPGIPAQERQRVFDRFFRGANAESPGSGLGLAIVQRIAKRHRASVTLDDNPEGPGLSVSVAFPVS